MQNWWTIITSKDVQDFILSNENADERKLVLAKKNYFGVPSAILADQIKGRRKAREKLPAFLVTPGIIFPRSINLEQTSSEVTSRYKCEFLKANLPELNVLVDLTGGFGVDSKEFSGVFKQVISVDPDVELNSITRWNFNLFRIDNYKRLDLTAEAYLAQDIPRASCFFADPSRRKDHSKVVGLNDCLPDITLLQDRIFQKSNHLLIKSSTLLDISHSIAKLNFVKEVIVLAVDNECRELLFFCQQGYSDEPILRAINLKSRGGVESFVFKQSEEKEVSASFGDVSKYLYEPNAAILKSGGFKLVGSRFGLTKLTANSHLYSGETLNMKFPGRIYEIEGSVKANASEIKLLLPEAMANVIVRNYPLSVVELTKKLKITEGGEKYLIATSTEKKKLVLLATRIK